MKTKTLPQDLEKFTQVKLIDAIINAMKKKKLSKASLSTALPFIQAFAKRINVSDDAAMIFCAFFFDFSDVRIRINDLADFYDCNQVTILTFWSAIEELVKLQYITQSKDSDGDVYYAIPNEAIEAIRENRIYTPKDYKSQTLDQWIGNLSELLHKKDHERISYGNFRIALLKLINKNSHLVIAREMAKITDFEDMLIFAAMTDLYIQNHDEHIVKGDIEDLFEHRWQMRRHARLLESGTHPLQEAGLIDYSDNDGQAEINAWQLSKAAKERFLVDIETSGTVKDDKNIKKPDSITPKELFFNPSVTKQVEQLESLLQAERFAAVQENLTKHGMRRGFACIFYGAPGTGKTESVLQLARKTGRGIMIVDVPNLRSKWVGDTEKNTKAIFERYRNSCKKAELAPILLFNEADAILCKRKEGAEHSVDKMENAMQNIILQEMETLDGIMIATTNLTGNLDTAFERRFLYKIEFPKPTPNESQHIWHSMLPEISEKDAYELAKQYSFSGGQIENIARKQIIDSILSCEEQMSMDKIKEACDTELFNRKSTKVIGFC